MVFVVYDASRKPQLLELRVPTRADVADAATFRCRFDLAGERLYSVKWYKDEFEFYRYMPDHLPPAQSFTVPGVNLQEESSGMDRVTLTDLTFNSSGTYRCEVSTEGPSFETVYQNSNMTVMALPRFDPEIHGLLPSYRIGDRVSAICTADRSNPAPFMTWYINGLKAERWLPVTRPPVDSVDRQGLVTRSLGLSFEAEERFFRLPRRLMELRCTAAVGDRARERLAEPGMHTEQSEQVAQQRLANHGCLVTPWTTLLATLATALAS